MEKFEIALAEEQQSIYYCFDARGRSKYSFRRKSGFQQRHFSGSWQMRFQESGTIGEAIKLALGRVKPSPGDDEDELTLDAGKFQREHEFLLEALKRLKLADWRISVKALRLRRIVRNRKNQLCHSRFSHFGITVRALSRSFPEWLEVSEGSNQAAKFNSDGLAGRIQAILDNWRGCRRIRFPEKVPVVFQAGEGAIFFHEILGHSLEADYVHAGVSPFTVRDIGRRIVPAAVNIATADGRDDFFSTFLTDDEGEIPPSPLLVEKGVLRAFLADCHYAALLGLKRAGHGRLEDFSHWPMPRMYAVYLLPGIEDADEIVRSLPQGVFAREFASGRVLLPDDQFCFHVRESFLIENGRITAPAGPVTVSGRIRDVLSEIRHVGNDFKYDKGNSHCYKNGQFVHVRVGQPTIAIGQLEVLPGYHD